ncbi:MAG: diguanylate cyclase [Gammaproteobacteria bacterium]|nr:diguanylate cyclase [Gammaproteobacteria bacterium]MBV9620794.1 diguanylate cyclase [Gammaproteobacteria bacterium]
MSTFLDILRLRRWSVGSRLLLINGMLILALATVAVIAWRALTAQSAAMAELSLISKAARYHQDADTVHANLRADVNAAFATSTLTAEDRTSLSDSLTQNAKDLRSDLETLEHLDLPADLTETETQVHALTDDFLAKALETGPLALRDPLAAQQLLPALRASGDALDGGMLRQTAAFTGHITRASQEAAIAESTAKRWLLSAAVLTSLVVLFLVWWLSRSIRYSLRKVRDVAVTISEGNLNVRSPVMSHDEIGELGTAINTMADRLNEVIGRLRAEADRDAFGTQLVEALEMADTEEEVYQVLARAMRMVDAELPMELLLADSSRAHLERATQNPVAGAPGCGVESPFSCMAVRRGNPVSFPDSEALNACARLRGRPCGPLSAMCVPLSFMGRSLGVLHATGPVGKPPTARQAAQLTTLGIQAGARIGTVRAFSSTQRKATTDSLTGLPNRRSAEERVRQLQADGRPFALVMADLDHFKALNDSRGHEAGDQALRLFAETMRVSLRDGDLAARWGGEEFVLVLPSSTAAQAEEVANRIRGKLAENMLLGGVPAFTASFGIADVSMGERFEQLLKLADQALYAAKEAGRDCVVIAGRAPIVPPRRPVEHPASPDLSLIARAD